MRLSRERVISSSIFVFIIWKTILWMVFILGFCNSIPSTHFMPQNSSCTLPTAGTSKIWPSAPVLPITTKKAGPLPGMCVPSFRLQFPSCTLMNPVMAVGPIPLKSGKSMRETVLLGILITTSSKKYLAKLSSPNYQTLSSLESTFSTNYSLMS